MADFLTTKRNEIQARLDELAPLIAERDGLQRALDALEGIDAAPAAAAPRATRTTTTRKSTRKATRPRKAAARKTTAKAAAPAKEAAAPTKATPAKATTKKAAKAAAPARRKAGRPRGSGQRSKQALDLVTKEPGLSAADIARKIGVHPNYAYRILPNLEEQGQVEKKNRKWYPKSK